MASSKIVVLSVFVAVSSSTEDWTFPPWFKFGAASAAYQVEGAWNVSDKSESIWDRYTHVYSERIADRSNGDVACDSYHLWKKDIELMKQLGLHFYRFSISWSRLLPQGFVNYISEDGKAYYNNLIDNLLAEGIEPLVTMHHFDLPQSFQDLGGWTNPIIVDLFGDYARVLFTLYGDRVKTWLTINEPIILCDMAYDTGILAPGIVSPELAAYLCNKNVLLAHAKAYRIYDEEFRSKYHGEVSIVNQLIWHEPATPDLANLTELVRENCIGRYSHPIYSKDGGWPPGVESFMTENSKAKGYSRSTFPAFTQEEIEFVRGTYDFYALNHYTSRTVRKAYEGEQLRPWPLGDAPDLNVFLGRGENWPKAATFWLYVFPQGIRRLLVWLKNNYGDMKYMITENGLATKGGLNDQDRIEYYESYLKQVFPQGIRRLLVWLKNNYGDMKYMITENGLATKGGLNDQDRIEYYESYLKQILLAIKEDGVNVTHYTAWTLIDNFEWMDGYNVKFGLYEVNFTDPQRTRTPRNSAHYYANIIKSNSLNVSKLQLY